MSTTRRVRLPVGGDRWIGFGPSAPLVEAAAGHEPGSTLVAAGLRASIGRRWVLTVEDRVGRLQGAVVLHRLGPAQWEALPLVVDDAVVAVLARIVDRSPASIVLGVGRHVALLIPHLTRARTVGSSAFYGSEDMTVEAPTSFDPRTRVATLADVPALADLFATYPLSRPPDRASWIRTLREMITDSFVVVADVDGEIVGALTTIASEDWVLVTDGVTREDHRGEGLGWAMGERLLALILVNGYRPCTSKTDENPMSVDNHVADHQALSDERMLGVALDPHIGRPSVRWRRRQARRLRRWTTTAMGPAVREGDRLRDQIRSW
ncbi:MAG: GNAT family N-acetyltransferase [Aquihabitans sp.]